MIEDILPFDSNTKQALSDIWWLRYKRNNFGCFSELGIVKAVSISKVFYEKIQIGIDIGETKVSLIEKSTNQNRSTNVYEIVNDK